MKEQLSAHPIPNLPEQSVAPKSKVTSLADKIAVQSVVSDNIKAQLVPLGLSLNPTLTKRIKSTSEGFALSAIEALKEAMASGNVENPGGWLNKAIKDGWMPNEKHLMKVGQEVFKEWFDLAYKQRLFMASVKGDDGQFYVYTRDGIPFPFEQMLAEHPLDVLRKTSKLSTL